MAKRYRTSIDITVDLDEFDDEAIKAYCLENNIFSKADIKSDSLTNPFDEKWWQTFFKQITSTERGIYTKEDLKKYLNDKVDNMIISMVD